MDVVPSLASEGVMDSRMLAEDHHFHDHVTPEEVLDALDQAASSLANGTAETLALGIEHQEIPNTGIPSETVPTSALDADHIQSVLAVSNDQGYVTFEGLGGVDMHAAANPTADPMLNEHDIPRFSKDLARGLEAEMNTDPSAGHSIAYPEPEAEQTPETPIVETKHPVAEPLRRMDGETIPITTHHKDSIIGVLDNAPPTAAVEAIQLKGAGEMTSKAENLSFQQPPKAPENDIPTDTPPEPSHPKSIYLEHIQVIEPDEPTEDDDPAANPEDSVQTQVVSAIGDSVTARGDQSTLEIEGLLIPTDVEPTSAVSTEFAIENDPALALTETAITTTTEASVSMDLATVSNREPQLELGVPPEAETIITTTTTVTAVVGTETEADPAEQHSLGADADADDQAEYMRRAERIQLEQSNMDIAGQDTQDKSPDQVETTTAVTSPEPVGESALNNGGSMPTEQLGQAPEITAGPTNLVALGDPIPDPPSGGLNPGASQYAIVLDAPSVVAPHGLFDQPKSPEWQGFAALDADAPGSPEFADHSSVIIEEPQNDPETNDASAQPVPLASTSIGAGQSRKPKMIMEVVIPIPGKGKKKATKLESPEPTTRGRSKSKSSSSSKAKPRSRSSGSRRSSSVSSSRKSTHSTSPSPAPKSSARKRTIKPRPRSFGWRKKAKKAGKPALVERAAHSTKVEVVMQKRPGLLRRTGSIPSGNNVKFAPTTGASKKRKAESEPDVEEQIHEAHSSDADAEGEIEEGYEDVEQDQEPELVSKPGPSKPGPSKPGPSKLIKRPRRSMSARKTPTKTPEVLTDSRRPKKRRVRR
ncbi:hypothetical protein FRC06_008845 [Ceratobasidium sp. 370]|nr:hypothetical protein FRC06_008845 [Ceratobasidium sp. 370]